MAPTRHSTAYEYITDTLREDILTGRLQAGDKLQLDVLATRFGSSVIPIREALRALSAERLVELRPHRTALVAELTLEELRDLYGVRLILDVEAVRRASGHLSKDELDELRTLVASMEHYAVRGEDIAAFKIHGDIHFRIYRAARSPAMLAILERLWDETERYRHAVKHHRSDVRSWAEEHRYLIDLLENGTPEDAAQEMRAHITRTLDALCEARGEPSAADADRLNAATV